MNRFEAAVTVVLVFTGLALPAAGQGAQQACRVGQTDQQERPASGSLLPALGRTFGVAPATLRDGSYVRCVKGRLMGCMVGANLNCGQANMVRHLEGADAFCHDNPGADVIPMAATGHDTIYDWNCVGTRAVAGKAVENVDSQGFMSANWRPVR